MPLFQSYMEVFVTNSPALLAQGQTVENIAAGQIGILDAKSYRGVTAPTYATNKALYMVWGTAHTSAPVSAVPLVQNKNIYSKLIKGRNITGWRGKKAHKGRTEQHTLGFSGDVSDTDTLTLKRGETKQLWFNLSGSVIDKDFTTQGLTRQLIINDETCPNMCDDMCENINPAVVAEQIVRLFNQDTELKKYGRASVITDPEGTAPTAAATCYRFNLTVCDTQDNTALGLVQSQYPNSQVTRVSTSGSMSVYEIVKDSSGLPAAFSNAGNVIIPDCPVCPAGYTLVDDKYVYRITRMDAGNGTALTAVNTSYSIVSPESTSRIGYRYGESTYIVSSDVVLTAAAGDGFISLGRARNACVITSPTTTAWVANGTMSRFGRTYRLTIADDICGTNRLADIQAAFPNLVVTIVDADGDCVHTYETTVLSNCVEIDCSVADITFNNPMPFEGAEWVAQPGSVADADLRAGVKFEWAVASPVTNECTYDFYSYAYETVHARISMFDENYNGSIAACDSPWTVKQIQSFQFPAGSGGYIREMEKDALSYHRRHRDFNPIVREIEGFEFQAKGDKMYDEYVLEFKFNYNSPGAWADNYTDSYHIHFYFPEGMGKAFETAMNTYVASLGNDLDPVIL